MTASLAASNNTGQRVGRVEVQSFVDSYDSDLVIHGGAHSDVGVDLEVRGDIDGQSLAVVDVPNTGA